MPFAKVWILGRKIFRVCLKLLTFRTLFSHSSYLVTGCTNGVCFMERIATVWYRYTREYQVDTYSLLLMPFWKSAADMTAFVQGKNMVTCLCSLHFCLLVYMDSFNVTGIPAMVFEYPTCSFECSCQNVSQKWWVEHNA